MDNKRKHRQQMKPQEILAVESVIRTIAQEAAKLLPSNHSRLQAERKGVTWPDVCTALAKGNAIEVHANAFPDIRALVRYQQTCVVLSLITGNIVTIWRNDAYDNHATLNLRQYMWLNDMVSEMQKIRRQS